MNVIITYWKTGVELTRKTVCCESVPQLTNNVQRGNGIICSHCHKP